MKIHIILFAVAPMAMRIPISLFFSITMRMSVLTMFNEATRTIRLMVINIINFSSFRALKRERFRSMIFFT